MQDKSYLEILLETNSFAHVSYSVHLLSVSQRLLLHCEYIQSLSITVAFDYIVNISVRSVSQWLLLHSEYIQSLSITVAFNYIVNISVRSVSQLLLLHSEYIQYLSGV